MTYKQLAKVILDNPDQWDNNVIVFDDYEKEYSHSCGYDFSVETNFMGDDHLIICF